MTSSTPGTALSACRAARSAGCSQVTAEIWGRVWRGLGAGRDVIVRSKLRMLHLRPWGLDVSGCYATSCHPEQDEGSRQRSRMAVQIPRVVRDVTSPCLAT